MNKLLLGSLLALSTQLYSRDLIISIDCTHQTHADTLNFVSDQELTATRLLDLSIPVMPGRKNIYTCKTPGVLLIRYQQFYFLVAGTDSLALVYNKAGDKYEIAGGRYPGNYTMYETVKAVRTPYETYKKNEDNYDVYVQQADETTGLRYALLDSAWKKSGMSKDVHDYVASYIKYMHLHALLYYRYSPFFKQQFPRSTSKYVTAFSADDFTDTTLANSLPYASAAGFFVMTMARLQDSSNYRSASIDYTMNHFTGTARNVLLHSLLINFNFGKSLSITRFTEIMAQLQKMQLPGQYYQPILEYYQKQIIEGKPIDPDVLTSARLTTQNGKTLSFKELQQTLSPEKEILIDFWASWCGPCRAALPKVAKMEKYYTILYLSLDTDKNQWTTAASQHQVQKNQFLLNGDYQNPLARYFVVTGIPRYVVLDQSGIVKQAELTLPANEP